MNMKGKRLFFLLLPSTIFLEYSDAASTALNAVRRVMESYVASVPGIDPDPDTNLL